jgi:hypothetical protein
VTSVVLKSIKRLMWLELEHCIWLGVELFRRSEGQAVHMQRHLCTAILAYFFGVILPGQCFKDFKRLLKGALGAGDDRYS